MNENLSNQPQKAARQWKISMGIGVFLIILAVYSYIEQTQSGATQIPQVGQPLKNFSLMDTQGKLVNLTDYRGKVILINSWATWCPPCQAEMPSLEDYYQANKNRNFELLAINGGESIDIVQNYLSENNFSFPILLDSDFSVLGSMGIDNFPTSILLGADGTVQYIKIGMFFKEDLENQITPFLQEN
jgi:peroxiredoxin